MNQPCTVDKIIAVPSAYPLKIAMYNARPRVVQVLKTLCDIKDLQSGISIALSRELAGLLKIHDPLVEASPKIAQYCHSPSMVR